MSVLTASPQPLSPRALILQAGALVLAVLAAYANIYANVFLLDDEFLITHNLYLQGWDHLGQIFSSSSTAGFGGRDSFYRPMQGFLYLLLYQGFGPSLFAFHFLNVALHVLNALLLYALGLRMGLRPLAVFLGALLWALHPLHTEAVTYMSATADTLYTLFCLAGLHALLPDFSARRMALAALCFIGGLLSKETALVFPLLALVMLVYTRKGWPGMKSCLGTWPLWLISAGYCALRVSVLKFDGLDFYKTPNIYTEHLWVRFYTFLATLPDYLALLLWPHDLHMDRHFMVYNDPVAAPVILGAAMLLAAGFVIFRSMKVPQASAPLRIGAWALLWFGAAHALHTGIALPVNAFFLEHWMYMPSMGLFLAGAELAAGALQNIRPREVPLLAFSFALLAAGALGVATHLQNKIWADPVTFYGNILAHGGGNARVHNNLAMALDEANDLAGAREHYEKAIEMYDVYPQTHYNLGQLILKSGQSSKDIADARAHFTRAIELDSQFYRAYGLLAQLEEATGNKEKAATLREQYGKLKQKYEGP